MFTSFFVLKKIGVGSDRKGDSVIMATVLGCVTYALGGLLYLKLIGH